MDLLDEDYAENLTDEEFCKSSSIANEVDEITTLCFIGFSVVFPIFLLVSQDESVEIYPIISYVILPIVAVLWLICILYFYKRYCEARSIYTLRSSILSLEEPYYIYHINCDNIRYVLLHRHIVQSIVKGSILPKRTYFRIELGLKNKIKYSFLGIPIYKRKVILGPFEKEPVMINEIKKRNGNI